MKTTILASSAFAIVCLGADFPLATTAQARMLVPTNSTWRYFKGTSEASTPTNAWRELEFDDLARLTGSAPFHFGTNTLGDLAIRLFQEAYGPDYEPMGAGRTIEIHAAAINGSYQNPSSRILSRSSNGRLGP